MYTFSKKPFLTESFQELRFKKIQFRGKINQSFCLFQLSQMTITCESIFSVRVVGREVKNKMKTKEKVPQTGMSVLSPRNSFSSNLIFLIFLKLYG